MREHAVNFRATPRGAVVGGRVLPSGTTDNNTRVGSRDREDAEMLRYLQPTFDALLSEIVVEIQEERLAGKVRPFVEGEPIGVIPRRVQQRSRPDQANHSQRMQWRREDMLSLRRQNDRRMREVLG